MGRPEWTPVFMSLLIFAWPMKLVHRRNSVGLHWGLLVTAKNLFIGSDWGRRKFHLCFNHRRWIFQFLPLIQSAFHTGASLILWLPLTGFLKMLIDKVIYRKEDSLLWVTRITERWTPSAVVIRALRMPSPLALSRLNILDLPPFWLLFFCTGRVSGLSVFNRSDYRWLISGQNGWGKANLIKDPRLDNQS